MYGSSPGCITDVGTNQLKPVRTGWYRTGGEERETAGTTVVLPTPSSLRRELHAMGGLNNEWRFAPTDCTPCCH